MAEKCQDQVKPINPLIQEAQPALCAESPVWKKLPRDIISLVKTVEEM